ncbi:MAG: hypothetical protein K6G16_05610 [Lachnospiraceae bacterium]|nr:hypothetical protein [Lachnospiraceae bacterium]
MKDYQSELQDLRHLRWAKSRGSSGTAGSFLKSYENTGARKRYYKLSDYDVTRGIVGHECFNEIIAQRLLEHLGIAHLSYRLIHALVSMDGGDHETWLCGSEDFKERGERKLALEDYYVLERQDDESPLDFCLRMGWQEQIYGMLAIDFLILNRDRHGANLEVLMDRKNRSVRLAPLFDHGVSLVCRCHDVGELKAFDVMKDQKVQSFIGGNSVSDNLRLVPMTWLKGLPEITDRDLSRILSEPINILGKPYVTKIREMLQRRWETLERFRNS